MFILVIIFRYMQITHDWLIWGTHFTDLVQIRLNEHEYVVSVWTLIVKTHLLLKLEFITWKKVVGYFLSQVLLNLSWKYMFFICFLFWITCYTCNPQICVDKLLMIHKQINKSFIRIYVYFSDNFQIHANYTWLVNMRNTFYW
jgi:hypothetical protein